MVMLPHKQMRQNYTYKKSTRLAFNSGSGPMNIPQRVLYEIPRSASQAKVDLVVATYFLCGQ